MGKRRVDSNSADSAEGARIVSTEREIEAAVAPPGGRLVLRVKGVPGLIVRCTARGRVYATWFRVGGSAIKGLWTLGRVDELSLAHARDAAREVQINARRGVDPREARADERRRRDEERRAAVTVAEVVRRFIESRATDLAPRSAAEYRRCLARYIEPEPIGGRLVSDLRRIEAREFLDNVTRKNGPGMARSVQRMLRSATAWGLENELLDVDPLSGLKHKRPSPRQRVLTDAEVASFWSALEAVPFLVASVLRLQLLTAVRFPSESLSARWRDVDLGARIWRIPAELRKGKVRRHDVPLSDLAVRLLQDVQEKTGREALVFAGITSRATVDYYFAKVETKVLGESGGGPFRPHDLRRSVADGLVRLGFASWPVADAVLGHGPRGTAAVYVHTAPMVEMAAALEKWGRHVEGLVSGGAKGAEVVPLGRA